MKITELVEAPSTPRTLLEKVTIQSPVNPWIYAVAEEVPDGVFVAFYRKSRGAVNAPSKLLQRGIVEQPFHVVLDHIHNLLKTDIPVT
jgi:hypothetical protein